MRLYARILQKTDACKVQVGRLQKVMADTSNYMQEDCKGGGGRRASAAEAPVREKTARGECYQKRPYSRRLRNTKAYEVPVGKTNACEVQVGRLWDAAKSDHIRQQLPQAAVCEKIAERARAATNNCVQKGRANAARAASCQCGEANVAESDCVQKTA